MAMPKIYIYYFAWSRDRLQCIQSLFGGLHVNIDSLQRVAGILYCANLNVNVIMFVVCFLQEFFYGREIVVADR